MRVLHSAFSWVVFLRLFRYCQVVEELEDFCAYFFELRDV